jgi:hypothetical protein
MIPFFRLSVFLFLTCILPLRAETLVRITTLGLSAPSQHAVVQWQSEAVQGVGLTVHVLIKEGTTGVFTKEELTAWKSQAGHLSPKEAQAPWQWKPDVHGAQIVWTNDVSLGCVVHIPADSNYLHANGVLPKEWVIWHELSHCIWPLNTLREEWWQALALPASGVQQELAELQEESWADAWALWLAKKYQKVEDDQVIGWMRSRTEEALKCKCLGHWTNATVSLGLAAFNVEKSLSWNDVSFWMTQTTLQAEDLAWLKWRWSHPDKKMKTPQNSWLKENATLLGTSK